MLANQVQRICCPASKSVHTHSYQNLIQICWTPLLHCNNTSRYHCDLVGNSGSMWVWGCVYHLVQEDQCILTLQIMHIFIDPDTENSLYWLTFTRLWNCGWSPFCICLATYREDFIECFIIKLKVLSSSFALMSENKNGLPLKCKFNKCCLLMTVVFHIYCSYPSIIFDFVRLSFSLLGLFIQIVSVWGWDLSLIIT